MMATTPAHDRKVTNSYLVHYPAHEPRESDPHYRDFDHYRRATEATAKCAVGQHRNDYHRGPGGVHVASAADFEAERYVRGLIS